MAVVVPAVVICNAGIVRRQKRYEAALELIAQHRKTRCDSCLRALRLVRDDDRHVLRVRKDLTVRTAGAVRKLGLCK